MPIRKNFIILLFTLFLAFFTTPFSYSSCYTPPILTGTIPAVPVSGQNVSIITSVDFTWGVCYRVNLTVTWLNANEVEIHSYHCLGMLTVICNSTDTTALGPLPPGPYTVHYYVHESFDCITFSQPCSFTESFSVSGCVPPVAQFSENVSQLNAAFTNLSNPTASSYLWDFGDGNTSTLTNPSHSYNCSGVYQVCLYAFSSCGNDTLCHPVTVTCAPPAGGFMYNSNQLNVYFTNTTVPVANNYQWEFGDGGVSTQSDPTHTYAGPGTYTVCLYAYSCCGADTVCYPIQVTCVNPVAGFSHNSNQLQVAFTNSTTPAADAYHWDFGDGNTSALPSPSHTYSSPGSYWVCLYTSDSCGADTLCDSVTVQTTGLERNQNLANLRAFPNPVQDLFTLELQPATPASLSALDLTGRVIWSHSVPAGKTTLQVNAEKWPSGFYLVKCEEAERSSRIRIAVQ